MSDQSAPPMDPNTSEATAKQLDLAREQGDAYGRALAYMTEEVAHDGGEQEAGHYRVGYAVKEAEGMYEWIDGELVASCPGCESSPPLSTPTVTRSGPMSSRCSGTRRSTTTGATGPCRRMAPTRCEFEWSHRRSCAT